MSTTTTLNLSPRAMVRQIQDVANHIPAVAMKLPPNKSVGVDDAASVTMNWVTLSNMPSFAPCKAFLDAVNNCEPTDKSLLHLRNMAAALSIHAEELANLLIRVAMFFGELKPIAIPNIMHLVTESDILIFLLSAEENDDTRALVEQLISKLSPGFLALLSRQNKFTEDAAARYTALRLLAMSDEESNK